MRIEPQLGPLAWARGVLPHPRGEIRLDLEQTPAGLTGTVSLPEGVSGELVREGRSLPLGPGDQQLKWG